MRCVSLLVVRCAGADPMVPDAVSNAASNTPEHSTSSLDAADTGALRRPVLGALWQSLRRRTQSRTHTPPSHASNLLTIRHETHWLCAGFLYFSLPRSCVPCVRRQTLLLTDTEMSLLSRQVQSTAPAVDLGKVRLYPELRLFTHFSQIFRRLKSYFSVSYRDFEKKCNQTPTTFKIYWFSPIFYCVCPETGLVCHLHLQGGPNQITLLKHFFL